MRVVFVGSNPSHAGSESPAKQNFYKWLKVLKIEHAIFINVSNRVTSDNRPLKKSEYELTRLECDLVGYRKVVALGSTASDALERLRVHHFKLPHPSPKNRALNDKNNVDRLLSECKIYLEETC